MQLFHVTEQQLLPRILEEGLQPQVGPRSLEAGEQLPAVFCFTSREAVENALSNWLGELFDELTVALVILELDASPELPAHSDVAYERAIECRIPASSICRIYSEFEF